MAVSGFAFMLDPIIFPDPANVTKQLLRQNATDVVLIPENTCATGHALMVNRRLRILFPHFTIKNDCSRMRIGTCRKMRSATAASLSLWCRPEDAKRWS